MMENPWHRVVPSSVQIGTRTACLLAMLLASLSSAPVMAEEEQQVWQAQHVDDTSSGVLEVGVAAGVAPMYMGSDDYTGMSWRAPEGWARGQALELIDDRSAYPGEQGFLYARIF